MNSSHIYQIKNYSSSVGLTGNVQIAQNLMQFYAIQSAAAHCKAMQCNLVQHNVVQCNNNAHLGIHICTFHRSVSIMTGDVLQLLENKKWKQKNQFDIQTCEENDSENFDQNNTNRGKFNDASIKKKSSPEMLCEISLQSLRDSAVSGLRVLW